MSPEVLASGDFSWLIWLHLYVRVIKSNIFSGSCFQFWLHGHFFIVESNKLSAWKSLFWLNSSFFLLESNKNRAYPWLFWLILEICCIWSNSRLSEKLICLTLRSLFSNRVKYYFHSLSSFLTQLTSFYYRVKHCFPSLSSSLTQLTSFYYRVKYCFPSRFSSLTLWAFSYYRVKHKKSSPSLLLKISVTLCKLALKSAIIHVKGRWKILWEDFQKDNICILQKGNQHHAHKSV